jgi:hypothetical protein
MRKHSAESTKAKRKLIIELLPIAGFADWKAYRLSVPLNIQYQPGAV